MATAWRERKSGGPFSLSTLRFTHTGALFSPYGGIVHDCAAIMHHTAPWYLPWGLKLVPLPIPPGHPASGIPNPGLHLLAPLPGIYAPEPRKVREIFARNVTTRLTFCYIDPSANSPWLSTWHRLRFVFVLVWILFSFELPNCSIDI